MREAIVPTGVPAPAGTYSAGVRAGNLLFLAGQGPFDERGDRVGDTFAEQARQTFRNLEAVANAAGTSLRHAVRVGAYLSTLNFFDEFNEVMAEFVSEPYPARTTVPVDLRGFDVEIDAVVFIPDEK